MQVSVEATGNLERELKVCLPTERFESEFEQRISELKTQIKVPGFRPGKVDRNLVLSRYGSSVRAEIVEKLIRTSLHDALHSEKLQPAGIPNIKEVQAEPGQPLEYVAVFEVYPEIKFADISAHTIDKPVATVNEQDIDSMLVKLQKQHANWEKVQRKANMGDRVVIDFIGTMEGKEFQGGSADKVPLVLGSKSMIEGFEQGIVGAEAGDERVLDLQFPADYHHQEVAGKAVQFKVTVNEVQAEILPALDDSFAERFELKDGGIEALRNEIKQNMQRELEFAERAYIKNQILEKLLAANEFECPKSLIEEEKQRIQAEITQELRRRTQAKNLPDLPLDNFSEQAQKRVKLGLLFAEAIKLYDIKADAKRVRERIEQLAAVYEQPELMVKWYYSEPERLSNIEAAVIEDQVTEKLLEQFIAQDKPMSYDEVVNPTGNSSSAT
jgi:trigger factor